MLCGCLVVYLALACWWIGVLMGWRVGVIWLFNVVLIPGPFLALVPLRGRMRPVMSITLNNWFCLVYIMFPHEMGIDQGLNSWVGHWPFIACLC